MDFTGWCDDKNTAVNGHELRVLTGRLPQLDAARQAAAAHVPAHYAAEEQIARILKRLKKPTAAAFIEGKLPTTKGIRSGDLGEILATEYIAAHTEFSLPVKRLRWKDHRNMSMRGDDVIGMWQDPISGRLRFLKTEAKSRVSLPALVISEARAALDKDGGLPSAHALSFISSRSMELGNLKLCDAIDDAQLKFGVPPQSVKHLLFTFSGNDPTNHLSTSLNGFVGPIRQAYVGLRVDGHGAFVASVYDLVIANANNH